MAKDEIDIDFITARQPHLHPIVNAFFDLSLVFKMLHNVPGFQAKLKEVIEVYDEASQISHEMRTRRGILFELQLAYRLVLTENEKITKFDARYESMEYDIETASGKLFSCKFSEYSIVGQKYDHRNQIIQQALIAKKQRKNFIVCIREKLSQKMEEWFNKHGIVFKDNLTF